MKVKSLSVKNFTVFDRAEFEFSPGINVLIGANGTGKSHVLKLIYAIEKALDPIGGMGNGDVAHRKRAMANEIHNIFGKLADIFKPADGDLAKLIRGAEPNPDANISLCDEEMKFRAVLRADGVSTPLFPSPKKRQPRSLVFIPPREALALYEGFQFAYANRELSFDGTYNDLCLALSGSALKGEKAAWAKSLIETLESLLDGKVQLKNNRFYVGKFEAHLVAEGLRKVASVVQLLRNGSIGENSVLFWDEPEAGLNPRLVKVVADALLTLASQGVQIILTTHDYLLSGELSLHAEYETSMGKAARPRFFCFTRESLQSPVFVESAETLFALRNNPILDEFATHYEHEQELFVGEGATND